MATDVQRDGGVVADARRLAAWADLEQPPYERIADEAGRLAKMLDARVRVEAMAAAAAQPEFARRIADRTQAQQQQQVTPVAVLYRSTTVAELQAAWRRQLREAAHAVPSLLAAEPAVVREWMMAWIEAKPGIDAFFRTEHARDYLVGVTVLARLLASPPQALRVGSGPTLYSDDFSAPSPHWRLHGPGRLEIGDGTLRLRGSGAAAVLDVEADDALIAFTYTPVATGPSRGGGPSCLFAFPAAPLTAAGMAASSGPMADYNYGIDTYHVSLFRGGTGCSNMRRTGRGLRMLSHVEPDPCGALGRPYLVELLRVGRSMQVFVDGRLVHAYIDGGAYGPVPGRGRFVLRTFSGGEMELTLAGLSITSPTIRQPEDDGPA
jgi:hypothetical protein